MNAAIAVLLLGSAALAALMVGRVRAEGATITAGTVEAGPPSGSSQPGERSTPRRIAGLWWAATLADLGVEGDPTRWARAGIGLAGVVAAVAAGRGGQGAGAIALIVLVLGAVVARRLLSGRGARRADAHLPALVEHAGRGLRSGLDLTRALAVAADHTPGVHGQEAAEVARRVEGGAPLRDALDGWAESQPRPPVALVVGAFTVATEVGGRPAVALDGVAATLRARAAVADEARSLASQARASAAVLVSLPLVAALGGAVGGAGSALLRTGWGRACLVVALGLDAAGAWWMHRIAASGGGP